MIPPFDRAGDDSRHSALEPSASLERATPRAASPGGATPPLRQRPRVDGHAAFLDGPLPARVASVGVDAHGASAALPFTRASATVPATNPALTRASAAASSVALPPALGADASTRPAGRGAGRVGVVVADRGLAEEIAQDLRRAGRAVTVAASTAGPDALRACEHADLVVFDVEAGSGATEIQTLVRARPLLRVVALVRAGDAEARIAALRAGADDALSLPADTREVAARVEAQLRRLDLSSGQRVVVEDGLVVDLSRLQVERGGRAFDLTPLEAGILGFVMREGHRVVGRDEILEAVWSDPTTRACARTVDVHIVALRRKLHGGSGSQRLIRTIRGFGYRWCG